jgi:hypothetical protein
MDTLTESMDLETQRSELETSVGATVQVRVLGRPSDYVQDTTSEHRQRLPIMTSTMVTQTLDTEPCSRTCPSGNGGKGEAQGGARA